MKDKFIRFMRSRYGNDQLSSFLTWGGLIFMVLDAFIKTGIFYLLGLFMFAYGYVRIMSKNYDKRAAQNRLILSILVDTFISKISLPMQPVPEIGSISVA